MISDNNRRMTLRTQEICHVLAAETRTFTLLSPYPVLYAAVPRRLRISADRNGARAAAARPTLTCEIAAGNMAVTVTAVNTSDDDIWFVSPTSYTDEVVGTPSLAVEVEYAETPTPRDVTTPIVVAATRLHEALWYEPDLMKTLPESVLAGYSDLQHALKQR